MKLSRTLLFGTALALAGDACGDSARPGDASAGTDSWAEVGPDIPVSSDEGAPDTGPDLVDAGCAEGTPCDDGDPCTESDACDAEGVCVGLAVMCDDGLDCTADQCDADSGECLHDLKPNFCLAEQPEPACVGQNLPMPSNACLLCDAKAAGGPDWKAVADGALCSDGDACTTGDHCQLGECKPMGVVDCEVSGNPCIDSACDPVLGCVETPNDAPCDDGNPCTDGDQCSDGECLPGATPTDCDDGDPCTVDSCDTASGCQNLSGVVCDDGDPCTDDTCLSGGSCENVPFDGPCEDGDLCTEGEICTAGTCEGGIPAECDDDNVCTNDSCDSAVGCQHFFTDGIPCDDGYACTIADTCAAGSCIADKTWQCDSCEVPVTDHGNKVVQLDVSADGYQGSGLDVDQDPATCAPASMCDGGVDNAMAVLAPLVNGPLNQSLDDGDIFFVADFSQATFDGEPFTFALFEASLAWSSISCAFQTDVCNYIVSQSSYDASCTPFINIEDSTIVGDQLTGGGKGTLFTLGLPIGGQLIPLVVAHARVSGTVTFSPDGTKIASVNGIVGGAAPKSMLLETLEAVAGILGVDPEWLVSTLEQQIVNDIDLDGDGVYDAASIGMRFTTIGAELVAF